MSSKKGRLKAELDLQLLLHLIQSRQFPLRSHLHDFLGFFEILQEMILWFSSCLLSEKSPGASKSSCSATLPGIPEKINFLLCVYGILCIKYFIPISRGCQLVWAVFVLVQCLCHDKRMPTCMSWRVSAVSFAPSTTFFLSSPSRDCKNNLIQMLLVSLNLV